MQPHLDPALFPETVEYLDQLGGDLNARPECTTKAVFFTDLLANFPQLIEHPSLSAPLREALHLPWREEDWMPSILVVSLLTMVRDQVHRSDEEFLEWNFQRQLRIYDKPFFRALMYVLSPTLLFMGSARRWKSFHRGSELIVKGDKQAADIRLHFPERAYSRAFLVSLTAAFRAALVASKAENASVDVIEFYPLGARYMARWG